MKILVTGGSGFLGSHLIRRLLSSSAEALRVLSRGGRPPLMEALGPRGSGWNEAYLPTEGRLELCEGSILEGTAVRRAVEGCEQVYHLAGLVSREPGDASAMMELHVEGTRLLLEECARARGVRRIVVVTTSGTVGVSREPDSIADDASGYPLEILRAWPYYLSKVYQEQVARDLSAKLGLDVVLVRPSLLLGPGDLRESSTGEVRQFLERKLPVLPSGGISFLDVRDAAAATQAAMEKGGKGESYLLTVANWTLREFFERLAALSGVRAPVLRLNSAWTGWGAKALRLAQDALGTHLPVSPISLEMSSHFWAVDPSKAQRELGFQPRTAERTLQDTIAWLEAGHQPLALPG